MKASAPQAVAPLAKRCCKIGDRVDFRRNQLLPESSSSCSANARLRFRDETERNRRINRCRTPRRRIASRIMTNEAIAEKGYPIANPRGGGRGGPLVPRSRRELTRPRAPRSNRRGHSAGIVPSFPSRYFLSLSLSLVRQCRSACFCRPRRFRLRRS